MTNARPRRAGQGAVDAQSIKKVTEICKDASPEDAQAALTEHNGDVQAAVMSLLDNPFQSVEKKKRRPQRPAQSEERQSNRDFPFRDNDRRGHDRSRGGGRGRGGDRSYDNGYDGTPSRGRGRGGRGRGRGAPRESEPVQPEVDVPPDEIDFGSIAPAISPPVEEVPPPVTHRVQHQSAPRPVSSAVVSDGISWAQKLKEKAAAPVQVMYEPEQDNDYDDRAYHEPSSDAMGMHNGAANEPLPEEPAQAVPQSDSFGSGYGHDAQASAWESTHQTHQTSAWGTSVTASPDMPMQDPHLKDAPQQSSQHQSFDQPPPGMQVNAQAFAESKPFDLRDLASGLPQTSTVQEESNKTGDFFDLPTQEATSQPPGFGPPGLQQNSPLNMFTNRNRPAQPADATSVPSDARDPASLISGGFGDFGHGMGQSVSMAPPSDPQQHHSSAAVSAQQSHLSHSQPQPPQQPPQGQDMQSTQASSGQQNQQEPSNAGNQTPQLPPDHSQHSQHNQHVHSFEPAFSGHAAPDSHRSASAKVNSSTAMFMPEPGPGDRLADGSQSQPGPQNAHTQDQDKQYAPENKGNNTNSEHHNQQLPNQAYQQLPHDVGSWGVPAMQADLYNMQRPGSAQLTPPMGQMVPGMGQMPNQMQAQYPMNPSMPAPGYGAPGYPPTNYPQQMGYAPGPYMQPQYNMQYPNSGYPYPGQMAPQAYAPSPSGPQMYGGPSGGGFGKQQGYMGDYNARGTVASGAGGVPGAGSGRGRGRGKNQKGRMAPSFSPQGGMHADPYNSNQGGYMDPGWMAQNQRFDTGFGKDKNVQPQPQYPPFGPGGYENPAPYGHGYGQFAQHSQFPQQTWNGQDKGVGAAKGNF